VSAETLSYGKALTRDAALPRLEPWRLLGSLLVTAVALVLAAAILPGLELGGFGSAFLVALAGVNLALVFLANLSLAADDDFQLGSGLFFAVLITLIIWLYDVYKPAYDARFDGESLGVTSVADLRRRVRLAIP
jgi:hypothetical protein